MKTFALKLASVLAFSAFISTASAQTPLLRYNFDEASSGSDPATDLGSGIAAPGIFQGTATRTANTPGGVSAGALDLNTAGAGIFVSGGDADKLDGLSSFTLSTWINLQGAPAGNLRLMSKQAASSFDGFSWNVANPASGTRTAANFGLRLFVGGSTAFAFDGTTPPFSVDADNKWTFLAVSYDGTSTANNVKYYAGGAATGVALIGTTTVNGGTVNASSAIFGLGYTDAASTSDTAPPGYLDDARVYSGVLNLAALEAVRFANVPEPSTYALLGVGASLLFLRRRKV